MGSRNPQMCLVRTWFVTASDISIRMEQELKLAGKMLGACLERVIGVWYNEYLKAKEEKLASAGSVYEM